MLLFFLFKLKREMKNIKLQKKNEYTQVVWLNNY